MSLLVPLPATELLFNSWRTDLMENLARGMLIPTVLLSRRPTFRRPRLVHA